ncbi:hypothetical protein F4777DRAFT_582053 [Nemania sp. FL0916]|nr:hypothetical protein F4777DRAFT_582053 [Nemania sp. FL0916]
MQPRRHSLSSGDEHYHPHPAKASGLPRQSSRRRARIPRSKSTSNVFDNFSRPRGTAVHDTRNVALEQADVATLRELADLLRTTGPPPDRHVARDECLRVSGSDSGAAKRWSLHSLRRNRRMKPQRYSPQSPLSDSVVPGTTADGHRYNAISTPASKYDGIGGPSFRSQYPIILPHSSPSASPRNPAVSRSWPERSSSKGAASRTTDRGSTLVSNKGSPSSNSPISSHNDSQQPQPPVAGGGRSGAFSNDVGTDNIPGAALHPVHEESEYVLEMPLMALGSPNRIDMGQGSTHGLPMSTLRNEGNNRLDQPTQAVRSSTASPVHLQIMSQRYTPLVSPEYGASSHAPDGIKRPREDTTVRSTLAVPKQNLLPESPGFPNMLEAMAFPSPPTGSGPSSPASSISVPDSRMFEGSRPMVRPRQSSRRARTSTSASAASLDKLIMQTGPSAGASKSDKVACFSTATNPESSLIKPTLASDINTKPSQYIGSLKIVPGGKADYGMKDRPTTTLSPGNAEVSQRGSSTSQLMHMIKPSKQASLDPIPPSFSSCEPGVQSRSVTVPQELYGETSQSNCSTGNFIPEQSVNVARGCDHASPGNNDVELDGIVDPYRDESLATGSWLCNESGCASGADSHPESILERRLARRARVREYKIRDIDASRVEVVDSPVLGYFASNLPGHNPILEGRLGPIGSSWKPSKHTMVAGNSIAINPPCQDTNINAPANLHPNLPPTKQVWQTETVAEAPRTLSAPLKTSAMMMTVIEPHHLLIPDGQSCGFTMSPIMVLADIEPRPSSPTWRLPNLASRSMSSSRTSTRLKSGKIASHARQQSHTVTMSRNPSTGMIERSSGPTDNNKFYRRSFTTTPNHNILAESIQMRKRLSLPPTPLSTSATSQDHSSRLCNWECQFPLTDEREVEPRARNMALKERIMQEKLQKEQEIIDIVTKTVGLPQTLTNNYGEMEGPPLDQDHAEHLENRLQRLERNNDAWLSALKPLLETMGRTLETMRVDDRDSSLRMSDFIVDMEAEAKRVSHSRHGEKERTSNFESSNTVVIGQTAARNNPSPIASASPEMVAQELDDLHGSTHATMPVHLNASERHNETNTVPLSPSRDKLAPDAS